MKELLNDIKTKLTGSLTNIKMVTVIPHEALIPNTAGLPAIGLLDSGDTIDRGKHQGIQKLTVSIVVYQKIMEDREASVMGGQSEKGVLEITDDIKDLLETEYFDGSVNLVKYLGSSATRAFTTDFNDYIAFKISKFEYHKTYIDT